MSHADDPYFATLESLGRVTVAGFGGALAGLSFARRGGAAAASRQAASALNRTARAAKEELTATSKTGADASGKAEGVSSAPKGGGKRLQRQRPVIRSAPPTARPYADRDLPLAWAVACTAFAGIVEFTRVTSPTSVVLELARGLSDSDNPGADGAPLDDATGSSDAPSLQPVDGFILLDPAMVTVSDYVIGGAFAGALFRGSAVRTKVGARLDSSMMGTASTASSAIKARPLSGILPGAALGLIAGIAIVAMDQAQVAVEQRFGQFDGDEVAEEKAIEREDGEPIPDDIKAMSNEELMKSIESLRSGREEADAENEESENRQQSEEVSPASLQSPGEMEADTEKQGFPDFVSALGFRPHPSTKTE